MEKIRSKLNNATIKGGIGTLKDENECLRMEIDYLKKLKDLLQKRRNYRTGLSGSFSLLFYV